MLPHVHIVVGLGYGDEGKGLATDWLCGQALARRATPLVVRCNGGPQAGHTVVTAAGQRHVFSNFGAGTLRGVPTYWSSYCPLSPGSVLAEYAALRALGVQPRLLVDAQCPVTTHYDVLYNRALEAERGAARHGSCGLGFGATVARQQKVPLYAHDLAAPAVLTEKLRQIRAYYAAKIATETQVDFWQFDHDAADRRLTSHLAEWQRLQTEGAVQLVTEAEVFAPAAPWQTYVFEGAQGVLLDQEFGTFPHVTRSRTTSANAVELLQRQRPDLLARTAIYGISRAYHTRHGAGPLPHETKLALQNHAAETNQLNDYQGHFRTAPLLIDQLNYALACERSSSAELPLHLVLTCLDQMPDGQLPCWHEGRWQWLTPKQLPALLAVPLAGYHCSHGPDGRGLGLAAQ